VSIRLAGNGFYLKTLFLIRHAKSSWSDPALTDHERPLNARGRRAAKKMGRRLGKRDLLPDLIASSPAIRALKTARIMARKMHYPRRHIVVDEGLYACSADELLRAVHRLDDGLDVVMLFGHNPELETLAHRLCSEITRMPTCAYVRLAFDTQSWGDVGRVELLGMEFDYPGRGS
jgi:phosphohistidine phosphatase